MRDGTFHGHPDHDACGTGLIVRLGQPASHEVVYRGLVALQRLAHRGGVDADGASGDGAGLLTGIPQRFIRRCAEELGIDLPRVFGMGMLFLPSDEQERHKAQQEIERLATNGNLRWLGWRKVPVNHSVLGSRAAETAPAIWQCFLASATRAGTPVENHLLGRSASLRAGLRRKEGAGGLRYPAFMSQPRRFAPMLAQHAGLLYSAPSGAGCLMDLNATPLSSSWPGRGNIDDSGEAVSYSKPVCETRPDNDDCAESEVECEQLEAELFLFRKRAETQLGGSVYFCSLSSRTVVYKGLLAPWQLPLFYPDLDSPDFESRFAVFHQRFSTNTEPSWSLAQPFRFLAHNGEINTIVGNRRWIHAREMARRREQHPEQWFHALEEHVSDSASLDNALELLVRQGCGLEAGLLTLIPPAFESNSRLGPFVRNFLEAAAHEYEPWDGPAALVFSDGRIAGAKLDRNGLRPLRYTRTADGWLVVGSEAGIADLEDKEIVERERLGPGEMLVVDLDTGELLSKNQNPPSFAPLEDRLRHGGTEKNLGSTAEDAEDFGRGFGWGLRDAAFARDGGILTTEGTERENQNQNSPRRRGDAEKNLGATAEIAVAQGHNQSPFNHRGHEGTRRKTQGDTEKRSGLTAEGAKGAEDFGGRFGLGMRDAAFARDGGILTTEGTEDTERENQNQNPPPFATLEGRLRHRDTEKDLGATAEIAVAQGHNQSPFNHRGHEGTRRKTQGDTEKRSGLTAEGAKGAEDFGGRFGLGMRDAAFARDGGILTTEGTEDTERENQNQNPPPFATLEGRLRHRDAEKNLGATAEIAVAQGHNQSPFNHRGHEGTRRKTQGDTEKRQELTAEGAKGAEVRREGLDLESRYSVLARGSRILTTEGTEKRQELTAESAKGAEVRREEFDSKRLAAALGWTQDSVRILLQPLAEGREAVWSMGDDAPPAFMSKLRRTLWDYCKQRFAQVTNPPIDPLRESHVMSLRVRMGQEFICESPVLDSQQLAFLLGRTPGREIDITFTAASGVTGALEALERIKAAAVENNTEGRSFVLLSDRKVSEAQAALPVLLATAAVWKAMVNAGNYRVPLIVETAQVFDTHHVALLLAVGATAVFPFLGMSFADEHQPQGAANYCRGIDTGLKKVLSRMGISTIASYRNGQLFETIGLDQQLCGEFFESAAHLAGTTSLEQVLEGYLHNHALAFGAGQANLKDAGLYRYRKEGEQHETSPEVLRKLHAHVETKSAESYRSFEELGWKRGPIAIRDLMEFVPQAPVQLEEVELESAILRRFSTQAMSLGAISPEAHRTLALAMNRLGARSNTGEGGEDPDLYTREPEAANKVKQIASGRFGVTAEYLVNAQEIEIKMAQGSKPGEGGQLPASKVTPYIAKLRHAVPGMSLISPPPHHDIYSIEDLAQLIHDLREVNPQARIGVKLAAGAGIGVIAAGVVKAGADVITVSGHNGGTGASPLSSIKNTALPWEFGLQDVHRTLVKAGLRQRIRLRVDGGLKFARDVVMAALLGADEFGFGTAALLAMGCVMARQCHLNTCPVGIATQDESLRARFSGNPEMVMAYFEGLATEVRVLLSTLLGARTIEEIVGRTERLRPRGTEPASDWMQALLQPTGGGAGGQVSHKKPNGLARQLAGFLEEKSQSTLPITNADLSVGAHLSGEMLRRWGSGSVDLEFRGVAGQSFGAFLVSGIRFRLWGEANDYVGKGLSGGSIAISAGGEASRRGDVLAGNTLLYGATSGELYIAGRAGERFAVRNSGALAVVEGVGDHGCEYMTGGVVLVLGPIGVNFGSGMTGGLAYVLGEHLAEDTYNRQFVWVAPCSPDEESALRQVLTRHFQLTESPRAACLLNSDAPLPLVRVQPATLPCSVEETWATVWAGADLSCDDLKPIYEQSGLVGG